MGTETVFAALLKLTGIRQIDLARDLGVNRSTLASWLSGYAPIPDDMVVRIHHEISQRLQRVWETERSP